MVRVADRIDEIFQAYSIPSGGVDMRGVFRLLWKTLSNTVSAVDLAGVFAVSIPSTTAAEILTQELFHDFFKAYARLKYPLGSDYCEKLLDEIRHVRGTKPHPSEFGALISIADKNAIRVLLKYDLPMRRAFSMFCGQAMRVGSIVSWDEVKVLALGMELEGFIAFAGAYSLLPQHLSTQQCEILFRDVLTKYPLQAAMNQAAITQSAGGHTHGNMLFYPQFQLLMVVVACEKHEMKTRKNEASGALRSISISNMNSSSGGGSGGFARKPNDGQAKHVSEMLQDLFRDIGINKYDESNTSTQYVGSGLPGAQTTGFLPPIHNNSNSNANTNHMSDDPVNTPAGRNLFTGTVVQPTVTRPQDMYTAQSSHTRQAMLLRMEHLFDEVEHKLLLEVVPGAEVVALLQQVQAEQGGGDGGGDTLLGTTTGTGTGTGLGGTTTTTPGGGVKARLPSKPVVIGDALPVPVHCPETVEQLLEASLAHHNLGSFEEALKFLEAARVQLEELVTTSTGYNFDHHIVAAKKHMQFHLNAAPKDPPPSFDVYMYILLCKGNVYQSCGDDEQALLQYMDAWHKAHHFRDRDWEIVAINAAGILAFFSLRYEVATLCFHIVHTYRETAYGSDATDTATALNNEASALFCLGKRPEARIRFEKSWNVLTKALGHRAPRCVTVWKNLEKARRAHASFAANKKDLRETIALRPDADRLIMGGTFTIQALPPPEAGKKKKKGGGGKKKKK